MWTLDDELNNHFEELQRKRKSGNPDEDDEPVSTGPMLVNEYAKHRGRNLR